MKRKPMTMYSDPPQTYLRFPLKPHELKDRQTKVEDTIVLCHLGVPRISLEEWTLKIDGLVDSPGEISFSDLKKFPRARIESVHNCAGSPLTPDVPTRRVCNVVWGGIRLTDLLKRFKPKDAAKYLWSYGADSGTFAGVQCSEYLKDLPLDRVSEDVLIATEMNDMPLRPENGYPVRLVVPGFYGTNSVKWLTRLHLAENRASGPFTTRWYNDVVADQIKPVWSIAPDSIVVYPSPGLLVRQGEPIEVWGWAWADGGVNRVQVSFDNAQIWKEAELEVPRGRSWQRFSHTWVPEVPGPVTVCARAQSSSGLVQPASTGRNAIHRVEVCIQ